MIFMQIILLIGIFLCLCSTFSSLEYIKHDFSMPTSHRVIGRLSYDGSQFYGWQAQTETNKTIQQNVDYALYQRFQTSIKCQGASRTDRGVHALGQTIQFDLPSHLYQQTSLSKLQLAINRFLPPSIRFYNISDAPIRPLQYNQHHECLNPQDIFHVKHSSIGKLYSYHLCTDPTMLHPIYRHSIVRFPRSFDINTFYTCLCLAIGYHNFRSFGNHIEELIQIPSEQYARIISPYRTIYSITMKQQSLIPNYYVITFHIQSAIRQMLRNLIGTAYYVAINRLTMNDFQRFLEEGPSRLENPAYTAPAQGLILDHVYYPDY